jgi:hypothetical protein
MKHCPDEPHMIDSTLWVITHDEPSHIHIPRPSRQIARLEEQGGDVSTSFAVDELEPAGARG